MMPTFAAIGSLHYIYKSTFTKLFPSGKITETEKKIPEVPPTDNVKNMNLTRQNTFSSSFQLKRLSHFTC